MAALTVVLEAHILDVRRGKWCDECFLPSVIEADVAFVFADTLRVLARYTESTCTECER